MTKAMQDTLYRKLMDWLYTECSDEDVRTHPKDEAVKYLGIDVLNRKFKEMQDEFFVTVHRTNFQHQFFTHSNKKQMFSGSIDVMFSSEYFTQHLSGAATFYLDEYSPNTHFAPTGKSLCITNAVSIFPQFGSLLNKNSEDVISYITNNEVQSKKMATIIERKKLENAMRDNDSATIHELNSHYTF